MVLPIDLRGMRETYNDFLTGRSRLERAHTERDFAGNPKTVYRLVIGYTAMPCRILNVGLSVRDEAMSDIPADMVRCAFAYDAPLRLADRVIVDGRAYVIDRLEDDKTDIVGKMAWMSRVRDNNGN